MKIMYFGLVAEHEPFDCADILQRNPTAGSGVYNIYPLGESHSVFCDMETDLGGWTVRTCLFAILLTLSCWFHSFIIFQHLVEH